MKAKMIPDHTERPPLVTHMRLTPHARAHRKTFNTTEPFLRDVREQYSKSIKPYRESKSTTAGFKERAVTF